MGVQQAINIAIFGMSLRVRIVKRTCSQCSSQSHQVNWSNIAEPQLDILMLTISLWILQIFKT